MRKMYFFLLLISVCATTKQTIAQCTVNAVPNQAVCNGTATTAVNFTGTPAGVIFTWTNNAPGIGLAASGTGNIPSFTATNTTNAPVVATITVTPHTGFNVITPTTTTFNYTGASQTFTVPAGVTSMNITTLGAEGGSGAAGGNAASGGAGGKGSRSTGTIAVTPGQVFTVFVGGAGATPTAGFNGGGTGGNSNAGGGGGASDVRFPGATLADRIIVGGGGGGGGRGGCEANTVAGGAGGNGDGNGTNGTNSASGGGGFGAIGFASGAAGIGCPTFLGSPGIAGISGAGGNGGAGQSCCCFNAASISGGGGGGGGMTGGGGGGAGSAGTVACTGQEKGGGGGGAGGTSYTGGVTAGAVTTNIQSGNGQVVFNYNVLSTSFTCTGTPVTFTITVNPTPDAVATPSSQMICSGNAMTTIAITGSVPSTTFNWTRDNTTNVTGIPNSGSGNISGTPINNTATLQIVRYTITPTANGCSGTQSATVNVSPAATINAVANQTVCTNTSTTAVNFSTTPAGGTVSWTNNTPGIGLAASGTGNIPAFTAVNTGTAPAVATITATTSTTSVVNITPTTTTFNYTGASQTFTVPPGVTSINITTLGAEGGSGAVGANAATGGAGGKGSRSTGTLNVTPGQVLTVFVGGAGATPAAGFNGGGTGGNANAGGGGGASDVRFPGATLADRIIVGGGGGGGGRGGCEAGTTAGGAGGNGDGNGVNGTNSPSGGGGFGAIGSASGAAGIGCPSFLGSPGIVGISGAGGNGGAGQTCCCFNASSISGGGGGGGGMLGGGGGGAGSAGTVVCTGQEKGGGGGGAGGTSYTGGVTAGAVTTNIQSGNGQVVFNYNVTNTTTCVSTRTFTITVNPTPNAVATPSSQTICSNTAMTTIALTSSVANTNFNWTRNNTTNVTGIPNSGSGNITGTPINNTTTQQTVLYTISPTADGCPGTPITATLIVNKEPTIVCPANIVVPSTLGACNAPVAYTQTVTGAPAPALSYTFTGATTGSGSGSGTGSLFNVGVTTVTVTATNTCGTASCSFTITVTDSQLPVITSQPVNTTVCAGATATFSVTATNAVSYQWQQYNGTAWVNVATGQVLTLSNVTTSMNTNTYRVIVNGLCTPVPSGAATLFVNPLPVVSLVSSLNPAILLPTQTTNLVPVVNIPGGSFVWTKNGVTIPNSPGIGLTGLDVDDVGTYRFVYTTPAGCSATSNEVVVSAQASTRLYVYPNPNNGHFRVRYYNAANEQLVANVFDSKGVQVYQRKFTTVLPYSELLIDLPASHPQGMYTIEVRDASGKQLGSKGLVITQ